MLAGLLETGAQGRASLQERRVLPHRGRPGTGVREVDWAMAFDPSDMSGLFKVLLGHLVDAGPSGVFISGGVLLQMSSETG